MELRPIKVLVVEDSEDDMKLALRALRAGGFRVSHARVQSAVDFSAALRNDAWDAVISDYEMPGFTGLDALRILRACGNDIPFILVSGTIGEEFAADSMKAGASDYVMKGKLARLAPALERELKEAANRSDLRSAHEALAASEKQFRQMADNIRDVFFLVDAPTGHTLYVSPAYEEIWGQGSGSPLGRSWSDAVHPEDRAAVLERSREGEIEHEYRILRPDGSIRWIESRGFAVRNETGNIIRIAGVAKDITERKAAIRDLRESERRFSDMLAHVELASVMLDREGRITYCNDYLLRLSGWRLEEVIGRDWFDTFMPSELGDMKPVFAALMNDMPEAWHRDNEIFTRSRERRMIRWNNSVLRNGAGEVVGVASIGEDITERRRGEAELRRFRAAMDASGDAILLIDRASMRYIDVNQTLCHMTGLTRQELIGKTAMEVFGVDRETLGRDYDAIIADRNDSANLVVGEYRHKDGSVIPVESRRRALQTENGWVIVATARDITERIESEARIKYLNRVYAVLSGINTLIVRVRGRDELFREACRVAVEAGGFRAAWIGIVDTGKGQIEVAASAGANADLLGVLEKRFSMGGSAPLGNSLTARAIRDKTVIVSNDSDDPEVWIPHNDAYAGLRSLAILPLIVADEAVGALALYAGEADFFHAEELKLLTELAGDIAFAIDHIEKQARLDYLAYYDVLTGLANRRLFLERVAQYMRSAAGAAHKVALFFVDIERFKNINDSLGRPAGDALLRQVAQWLTTGAGAPGLVARVGPDQFAIVMPQVKADGDVMRFLESRIASFRDHPFNLGDSVFRIAIKVGVALFPEDGDDAGILLRNAEAALKKAKEKGARYLFYKQKMTDRESGKLTLENKLRLALDNEQFVLHYQPKVNLQTGKLTGAEALIRWNDPQKGLVPPGLFIPNLEETGLIHDVGRWAMRNAAAQYLRWRAQGLPAVRIAVNVSPLQLRDRGFVVEVERAIGIHAHAPEGLELEITESLIMEDVKHSIASLQAIRDMNVTIAIDDFGTGFSSLSYLAKLPVDTLKIDRSFVIDMTGGPDGLSLVSTIINLAHSLKLKVVAEGVETDEQKRLLRLLGCNEMQGYLFSKPVPAEDFEARFLAPTRAPG